MIDIKKVIDLRALQDIQNQFSDATGLAAIAVDSEGHYITEGSNFTEFCMKYTRGCEEGLRRCVKCDNECTGTYFCHAGLMDFSADICINGEKVGAIIGGQVLPKPPDIEDFVKIARELGINENEYIEALKKVPIRSEKMIRASSGLLSRVVNELVNLEYLKKLNKQKIDVFDTEVQQILNSIQEVTFRMNDLQRTASMENILSLNASIEAARAGNAGVGFAVVAKELGDLARNSASVYVEIQDLTKSIGKSVKNMRDVDL